LRVVSESGLEEQQAASSVLVTSQPISCAETLIRPKPLPQPTRRPDEPQ
jgi:hypothetical protein